jgi:hypothetical protein
MLEHTAGIIYLHDTIKQKYVVSKCSLNCTIAGNKKSRWLMKFRDRVFTEVTFWNSAEYGILCGSDFTSAELSTF